jgi:hypothetical protein
MVEILLIILAFNLGIFSGYICRVFIVRKAGYSGIILVTEDEERKIFSLELNEDPEVLEDRDEVIFKVSKQASQ